jgi:hypothetical protein
MKTSSTIPTIVKSRKAVSSPFHACDCHLRNHSPPTEMNATSHINSDSVSTITGIRLATSKFIAGRRILPWPAPRHHRSRDLGQSAAQFQSNLRAPRNQKRTTEQSLLMGLLYDEKAIDSRRRMQTRKDDGIDTQFHRPSSRILKTSAVTLYEFQRRRSKS